MTDNQEVSGDVFDEANQAAVELESAEETLVLVDEAPEDAEVEVLEQMDPEVESTPENWALLERVEVRAKNIEEEWHTLTQDVYEVCSKKVYQLKNFAKIEDYFKSVGLGDRLGFYLRKTYEFFHVELPTRLADRPEVIEQIQTLARSLGRTKVREIATANIADVDVVIDLVKEAAEKGFTVTEIKQSIKNYKRSKSEAQGDFESDKDVGNKPTSRRYKGLMQVDAEKIDEAIQAALNLNSKENTDKNQSQALVHICEEWLEENRAAREGLKPSDLAPLLLKIEERYDVKLAAFKPDYEAENKSGEKEYNVVHGEEILSFLGGETVEAVAPAEPEPVSESEPRLEPLPDQA